MFLEMMRHENFMPLHATASLLQTQEIAKKGKNLL